ncbi:MAG: BON domain-containing protein [Pseudomonadota bacterium]|nr:BON domain-containing protein [Pseudomonadota bacterium]
MMATISPKDRGRLAYPYGQVSSSDEEVLAEVLNALHHHSGVPQERLQVEVRQGHAVLSGVVESELARELAECTAAAAPGVVEVINHIRLES